MKKEFNLSNKIWKEKDCKCNHIHIDNVKEFIRLLKEIIPECLDNPNPYEKDVLNKIDKLAGDKLKEDLKK